MVRAPKLRHLLWLCCLSIGAVFCFRNLVSPARKENLNDDYHWQHIWDNAPETTGLNPQQQAVVRVLEEGQALLGKAATTQSKGRNGIPSYCPGYTSYSTQRHIPLSKGPLRLPFQRPSLACRTFVSPVVEDVIDDYKQRLVDPDLARLFENCFPNTLDTTISWHKQSKHGSLAESFIVTGDIDAEWLRDSYRQLRPYQALTNKDPKIKDLILGAINTQAHFVSTFPYCNAFLPPKTSGIWSRSMVSNGGDAVFPPVDGDVVFECKYELDSLASFLGLSNEYFNHTEDFSFVNDRWMRALRSVITVLRQQTQSTYSDDGEGTTLTPYYTFQRQTNLGTETLNLAGAGNPVNANTSLIRSAFRPSDDATIYQFFIPANAQIATELKRLSKLLEVSGNNDISSQIYEYGANLEKAIWEHGVYHHKIFGDVFAYEVDGYGGVSNMDDANLPSLLSLPEMGFVDRDDPIYLNTRRMILSKAGNPYYLNGKHFSGVGGPHIGTNNAWPMSLLVAMRTSNDENEIKQLLAMIKISTSGLGLMHETVNVNDRKSYTRPWFAWANSEFANTIFDISERFPHLIFGETKVASSS